MAYKKLLVVDDNEEVLKLIHKKLVSEGFQAVRVSCGEDAVKKAIEYSPDLILMDIILPDIDGADAAKLLQENPATQQIPILFMSGIVIEDSDKPPTIKVGEKVYRAIGKPFTWSDLLKEINELIS